MMLATTIPGPPIPQKQTRFVRGKAYDPSSKDKERIRKYLWSSHQGGPLEVAVEVLIKLFFQIPKSYTEKERSHLEQSGYVHTKKPDADNCAYLITNAMKGLWIVDDSQIVNLHIYKRYTVGSPETVVEVLTV